MKNTDDSFYMISVIQRKPSHATTKLTVSKDEWNTKENTSKSLKACIECTSRAEVMLNGEKIKLVALAIIELRWSEGIRQLGSQSVSQ